MSKVTGKILTGVQHWQAFFFDTQTRDDEVKGLLSAKFEEEIK